LSFGCFPAVINFQKKVILILMELFKKINRLLPFLLFTTLAFTYIFILAKPIDLSITDIGRHLINGREIVSQNWQVLFENTYSYTMPEQRFINHHWLSGVVFWVFYSINGFFSLHVFHTLILIIFLMLFFNFLKLKSSWNISFGLTLLALVFFATRTEVRPESFGLVLTMIYLTITHFIKKKNELKWPTILSIILLQILWVNLHISFVFGLFVFGLFTLLEVGITQSLSTKVRKNLVFLVVILGLSSLLNPNTIQGALSPFTIFQDYGYKVFENQNLWFLRNFYKGPIIPMYYLVTAGIIGLFFAFPKVPIFEKTLAITGIFLGWTALRNIPLFVIFTFPFISMATKEMGVFLKSKISIEQPRLTKLLAMIVPLTLLWLTISSHPFFQNRKPGFNFGLIDNQQETIGFLKNLPAESKIFNNYDVGSALVYSLYPEEKVFVDNRPEAYSSSFFQDLYIPSQNSEQLWEKAADKFQFTHIVFGHRDITPWAQTFIKNRLRDNSWKMIYIDEFILIFAKDIPENKDQIDRYAIEVPLSRLKI
jgi:hypothetical protein